MDDYSFWLITAVLIGIAYLFLKYGKLQFAAGHSIGFVKGKTEGLVIGTHDAFQFLEGLGIINLDQLSADLNAGKFDHIGKIAESREFVNSLLGKTSK